MPTIDDCVRICNDYIILAAKVIVENISDFNFLHNYVVKHIAHKETARKSVIVSEIVSQTSIFLIHVFFFHNVPIKSIQFVRGSLLQLPNLLNQRNVEKGVTGCFNATLSFFELIHCHIIVAALHFFGTKGINDSPTFNTLPSHMEY